VIDRNCAFQIPGEGQCWHLADASGYCAKHLKESPAESQALSTLSAKIRSARERLDDLGTHILKAYVVFADDSMPEDLRRAYRNAWYRWRYLVGIRDGRLPGQPLPAEVTMPPPTSDEDLV
jgi:hypothetical protein